MKKSVLFVDDEPLILQGLRRMLHDRRGEWDMHFVEGGDQALSLMERMPVDVVVSDMRMPGINGAQLLNQVMARFPRTVRIILSGHADRDLILRCIGSTHQYLTKPCDPDVLRATVTRALRLDSLLESERLQRLVGRMEHLPSMPTLYAQIMERLGASDVSLDEIGEIVARDPGMTATILKLVNSAYFSLRREVSSANEAIVYLGLDIVKSLVLSIGAFSQFESARMFGFPMDELWNHSMRVAAGARRFALSDNSSQKIAEESFAAGLLHDAGKLILAFNFPDAYAQTIREVRETGRTLSAVECERFGADHAAVGGYLLGLWGLPVPMVDAIAHHHAPGSWPGAALSPLMAVHVADALMNTIDPSAGLGGIDELDPGWLAGSGLESRIEIWREQMSNESS